MSKPTIASEFHQDLWDRIAVNADELPVPEEHLRIIEERLRESPTSPEGSLSWDEVKARFRDRSKALKR
jgi:hypothetical protein